MTSSSQRERVNDRVKKEYHRRRGDTIKNGMRDVICGKPRTSRLYFLLFLTHKNILQKISEIFLLSCCLLDSITLNKYYRTIIVN